MVGDLYLQAIETGNTDVQVVHTGRMNNKTIAMATAMPILAESAGLNYEDVIHASDAKIHQLVEENQVDLKALIHEIEADPTMQDMQVCIRALRRICKARNVNPDTASSSELVETLLDEYNNYPRISTSTLMKEQMLQNVAEKLRSEGKSEKEINEVVGKLDEFTDEEPDSVDTVTNFTNSIPIILSKQLIKEGYDADEVGAMSTEQKMELLADTEMTAEFVADIAYRSILCSSTLLSTERAKIQVLSKWVSWSPIFSTGLFINGGLPTKNNILSLAPCSNICREFLHSNQKYLARISQTFLMYQIGRAHV